MDDNKSVSEGFSNQAKPPGGGDLSAAEMREIFSSPLGVMLAKMGVITHEQQERSAERQALMVAVRGALEGGSLQQGDLPQFKGEVDFLALASMKDEDVVELLSKGGIGVKELGDAYGLVNSKAGVNRTDEKWKVPMIGQIHAKLHGNAAIAQAALTVQQAIRAEDTALRLHTGTSNPALHDTKREFNFSNPKDDPRLQEAVEAHRRLSVMEQQSEAGVHYNVAPEITGVQKSFDHAAVMFTEAGLEDIAWKVRVVARSRVEAFSPSAPKSSVEGPGGAG